MGGGALLKKSVCGGKWTWLIGGKQPGLEGCQNLGHGSLRRHAVPIDDLCGGGGRGDVGGGGETDQFCDMGQGTGVGDHVLGSVWLACLLGQYFVLTEVKL